MTSGFEYSSTNTELESNTLVVGPPLAIAGLAAGQVFLQALAMIPAVTLWHTIGYLIGLLSAPLTVFAYRRIDRIRQRSGAYVSSSGAQFIAPVMLVSSVALAIAHAYYLALQRTLA